jgi:hypothetical protein
MSLSTWLALADDPAELDGYGPIPAALARQIAAEAARDHPTTTTWRCVPSTTSTAPSWASGDTIPTPGHDPTPRMRNLATTADPTCVWPNCSFPIRAPHRALRPGPPHPHEKGGVTCPCNLARYAANITDSRAPA